MIYGVLLAAGMSRRMGQPKQFMPWQGQPLVGHVAQQVCSSRLDGLVVVLGHAAQAVGAAVRASLGVPPKPVLLVENAAYAAGQAGSLRAGLAALPPAAVVAVVLLVDQPLVTPALLNWLVDQFGQARQTGHDPLALVPCYQGRRGNPVLLTRALFAEARRQQGDIGARAVLQRHAARVAWLETDDPAVVTDIDTVEDYERLYHTRTG